MENKPTVSISDLFNQGEVAKPARLLGKEDKEALAAAGTPFTVTDIRIGDDKQFGPYWEVSATLDNEPIQFRLSQHDRRDTFMSSLAAVITNQSISGLRLKGYDATGGNQFIALEPA